MRRRGSGAPFNHCGPLLHPPPSPRVDRTARRNTHAPPPPPNPFLPNPHRSPHTDTPASKHAHPGLAHRGRRRPRLRQRLRARHARAGMHCCMHTHEHPLPANPVQTGPNPSTTTTNQNQRAAATRVSAGAGADDDWRNIVGSEANLRQYLGKEGFRYCLNKTPAETEAEGKSVPLMAGLGMVGGGEGSGCLLSGEARPACMSVWYVCRPPIVHTPTPLMDRSIPHAHLCTYPNTRGLRPVREDVRGYLQQRRAPRRQELRPRAHHRQVRPQEGTCDVRAIGV